MIDGCISLLYTLFDISAKEIGMIRDLDFDRQHMQSMGLITIHGFTAQREFSGMYLNVLSWRSYAKYLSERMWKKHLRLLSYFKINNYVALRDKQYE